MSEEVRVALVDDSIVVRSALAKIIEAQPGLTVVGTASNGKAGVDLVRSTEIDIVVLDVDMPVMTGIEALIELRTTHPRLPVVMFSSLTEAGATATIRALAAGASDYAAKPSGTSGIADAMRLVEAELINKLRALTAKRRPLSTGPAAATSAAAPGLERPAPAVAQPRPRSTEGAVLEAVIVGSSTGGPAALEVFLGSIRSPLSVPMFLVQHMPERFTKALADQLDRKTASTVLEAADGMVAKAGHCYIAPGGFHMKLKRQGRDIVIRVVDEPPVNSCKPSVDTLFRSAAEVFGARMAAVMLTGMGTDGLDGTRVVAANGCDVLVQDEATSVIWGMPGAVAEAGLATAILPLDRISSRVISLCLKTESPMSAPAI